MQEHLIGALLCFHVAHLHKNTGNEAVGMRVSVLYPKKKEFKMILPSAHSAHNEEHVVNEQKPCTFSL